MNNIYFKENIVETPLGNKYHGLLATGEISAVIILRAGATFEVCSIGLSPSKFQPDRGGFLDRLKARHSRLQNWAPTHTVEYPDW
jgi:hypothetical protein